LRGTADDVEVAVPLVTRLPGLLQDDDFVERFTAGLDAVLAPVIATLDSLDAYFDPQLAPLDFVRWLAGWVGLEPDASLDERRLRELVAGATEVFARRGTVRGLARLIELCSGVVPEIEESGGTSWTSRPGTAGTGDEPGAPPAPWLVVRLRVPSASDHIDHAALDRLVASAKPAHVPHRVEILAEDPR
jgi:phage tail-like protein